MQALAKDFDARALQIYEDALREIGYPANRFRQKIQRSGGVAAAKQWLRPKAKLTKGFLRLLDYDRLDLSVEAVVLQQPWSKLFSAEELATARQRLKRFGYYDRPPRTSANDAPFPDEIVESDSFAEGRKRRVVVNAYERAANARKACIDYFGVKCYVCGFDFESVYGDLGRGYIQVHHLTPFSPAHSERNTDPREDLRPVCANCHCMLHREDPPVPIATLKKLVSPPMLSSRRKPS